MRQVLSYVTFFALFLLFPINGNAAWYCEYTDLARLKSLASNIGVVYDYEIINNDAVFTATITNVHKDLYIYDNTNNKYYYPNSNSNITEFTINNLEDGKSYLFTVYTTVDKCQSEVVYNFYVTTLSYNKFFNDPLCSNYQDYKLCQRWANLSNVSYDKFKLMMNEYIESLKPVEIEKEKEEETMHWLLEFYLKYYMYILPITIVGLLLMIYYLYKKDDIKL